MAIKNSHRIIVTGGAGFIGCNVVTHFAKKGWEVSIVDNLSREGTNYNLEWLRNRVKFNFYQYDMQDAGKVLSVVREVKPDAVIHLAGQVAVTTSVAEPRADFESNAFGTFNLLEAIRQVVPDATAIYSSTNKVYGLLHAVPWIEKDRRYAFENHPFGISEEQPLDFHSPYGCSKGSADQYFLDYARIYGLKTIVFRQSCIYGHRQLGIEDQGWVAWFIIAHVLNKGVTVYGNGKQVRDLLFIEDLVDAFELALEKARDVAGQTFNIGGGAANTVSLVEFIEFLEKLSGRPMPVNYSDWRPGDQPIYISDIRKAGDLLGWRPKISVNNGLAKLYNWVMNNRSMFADIHRIK